MKKILLTLAALLTLGFANVEAGKKPKKTDDSSAQSTFSEKPQKRNSSSVSLPEFYKRKIKMNNRFISDLKFRIGNSKDDTEKTELNGLLSAANSLKDLLETASARVKPLKK